MICIVLIPGHTVLRMRIHPVTVSRRDRSTMSQQSCDVKTIHFHGDELERRKLEVAEHSGFPK